MVLRFRCVGPSGRTTFWSEGLIAASSHLWSMIESRRTYWFPLGLHCAYIASAIKFAFSMVSSHFVECERVLMRVKDGVGVSQSDGVTIFVPFPGIDMALH